MARRHIPQVVDGQLIITNADESEKVTIAIDSPAWFSWINDKDNTSFAVVSSQGSITLRRERQRRGYYWYAYRWYEKKLHKSYVGKSEELTYRRLAGLMGLDGQIEQQSSTQTLLHLSLLGAPEIIWNGQKIEKLGRKALLLLAYLAVHDRPQTRTHLLALLWAESSEEAARKNLRNALWSIRSLLGEQVVQGNAALSLNKAITVDVWAFERLVTVGKAAHARAEAPALEYYRQALVLYRGAFLDGVTIEDSSEMHLWLLLERERLNQSFLRVLLILIDAARRATDWSTILALTQRALAEDPLQEPIYRLQMEAAARLGERSQALRYYETLRTVLEHELDVEPLPETEALREAILRGALEPVQPVLQAYFSPAHAARTASSPRTPLAPSLPFVGRQPAWSSLDTELQCAAQGEFRILLLTGETGIGKTRLWQEWSHTLNASRKRATIINMLALEVTQSAPFAPVLLWFSQSSWSQHLFSPASLLPPASQSEILRLLPTLQLQHNDQPYLPIHSPEEERLRRFELLNQALLAIQRHENMPLILFLDDAHWSDAMTLQWFDYLTERLSSIPFFLLLAYRPQEAPPTLEDLAARWRYQKVARRLSLPHLNEQEALELMSNSNRDTAEKHYLYKRSAGNPYVLRELLQVPAGDVPPSLMNLVRTHIARLPATARQVIQAAAILEPGIDFETLRRTCGRSEDETLDAIDELTRASFLVEQRGQYAFAQPLVATIVRETLGGSRRVALHRRAANACELMTVEQLPLLARQLVLHYQGAGEREQAAHYAEVAAEHARTMTDWDEAIRLYQQARTLAPTPARTLHLGRVLLEKGDFEEARAIFKVAFHEYQAGSDQAGAARAGLNVAIAALKKRHLADVFLWTQQAQSLLRDEQDPAGLALAHMLLASASQTAGQVQEATTHRQAATELIQQHNLPDLPLLDI